MSRQEACNGGFERLHVLLQAIYKKCANYWIHLPGNLRRSDAALHRRAEMVELVELDDCRPLNITSAAFSATM